MKEEEASVGKETEMSPEFFSELVERVAAELDNPDFWENQVEGVRDDGQNEVTIEYLMITASFMIGEEKERTTVFSELTPAERGVLINRLRRCPRVASGAVKMTVTDDEITFSIPEPQPEMEEILHEGTFSGKCAWCGEKLSVERKERFGHEPEIEIDHKSKKRFRIWVSKKPELCTCRMEAKDNPRRPLRKITVVDREWLD